MFQHHTCQHYSRLNLGSVVPCCCVQISSSCPCHLLVSCCLKVLSLADVALIALQVTIWLGVFPIVVSWWAALGLTVYFIATNAVLYYVKSIKHIEALWFANCANQLLFWTYIKVSCASSTQHSCFSVFSTGSFPCCLHAPTNTRQCECPFWAQMHDAFSTNPLLVMTFDAATILCSCATYQLGSGCICFAVQHV